METVDSVIDATAQAAVTLEQKRVAALRSGVGWMKAICVLTLLNALAVLLDFPFRMAIGMALTDIAVAVVRQAGPAALAIGLLIAASVAACMWGLTWLFRKTGQLWPAIVLIAVYALDMLPALLIGDLFGAGFHVLALVYMIRGVIAFLALRKERAAQEQAAAVTPLLRPAEAEEASVG